MLNTLIKPNGIIKCDPLCTSAFPHSQENLSLVTPKLQLYVIMYAAFKFLCSKNFTIAKSTCIFRFEIQRSIFIELLKPTLSKNTYLVLLYLF